MKEASIEITQRGRIQIICMKRPDRGNRVSQQMAEHMITALEHARRSPDVSACVLTGHGDVFCLGGDYQGAGPTNAGGSRSRMPSSIWRRRWRGSASR